MSLHDALGGLRNIPQWFIWRLVWNDELAKYEKTPCALDGSVYRMDASKPENWNSYDVVRSRVAVLNATVQHPVRYALGYWMTRNHGYWFLDLDECATDGVLTDRAQGFVGAFPNALMEWSSSGRGIHIIGRATVPKHRSRDTLGWKMEFYDDERGIAFGLSQVAQGDADSDHTPMVAQLVAQFFPPRPDAPTHAGARPEWRGPADDDELIRRMLASKPSAAAQFGQKASVQQLWAGDVEPSSEHDMALASHLAWWTGCDEDRMYRLMMRSGLKREKWIEHRTYLRELTIRNAIANCTSVYQEPLRDNSATRAAVYGTGTDLATVTNAPGKPISPEQSARYKELDALVGACGTIEEMHNDLIPAIAEARLPAAYTSALGVAINKQLKVLGADKLPINQLRRLLSPPVVYGGDAPLWVHRHCYVKDRDVFYDTETGAEMSFQGFQAEYTRLMPMKENGQRENPIEWALNRWNMRTVQSVAYRPDRGPFFEWDGLEYANRYNENSIPQVASAYTEAGIRGITEFRNHLFDMCGRRMDVFNNLLWWLAHNVKQPGRKLRWSPILKGINGDGKTLISEVLRASMGFRNVSVTGNSMLTNSGGFTDWAVRAAVNFIEEIMLVGKARHQLYNAMKEYITNNIVSINGKGKAAGGDYYNVTNHIALTNHNDAIPLEASDRRWFVIFTPWSSLDEMWRYCGLDAQGWEARTAAIDYAYKHCAGELRAWFLSIEIGAEFRPDSAAMMTPEKRQMMATGQDDVESIALQIIEDGAPGVTKNVFCSSSLSNLLRLRAAQDNFDVPKTSSLSHMFTRIGYSKLPKAIKWKGQAQTIWVKNGYNGDIRSELDNS